ARAAGRQGRRHREAADPLRRGRLAALRERGRARRPSVRGRAGCRRRQADLPRQCRPPDRPASRARQGDEEPHPCLRHRLGRFERHAQRTLRAVRVGGLSRQARLERSAVLASLALVAALAWLWLWRAGMSAMDAMDMPDMAAPSRAAGIALAAGMGVVMMTGMMLPSAAPTIVFYGALVRKNAERGNILPALWIFTSGYLAVWAGFSLAAALLQAALEQAMLLTPALASASPGLSAAVLIAAGLYQWSPVKQRCLQKCRNPIEFFAMHWHAGQSGA